MARWSFTTANCTLSAPSKADADLLRIIRELGLKSYMGVPLSVRGRVLGVITFIAAESGRRYEAADLTLAEDPAHRAALAIENAQLYQSIREADRRKDEFLALLGHELRNPLAPLRNTLHVLKLPGADAAIALRARAMMERQVDHMVRLVDDLLDVSRIMRGKVELRWEAVEMFFQIERRTKEAQGGLGIGLTLVQRLVAMHGGSVEAHSAGLGKGSEFRVRLPLPAREEKKGQYSRAAKKNEEKPSPRRVLVALTGWGQSEDRQRTRAAGFDHHFVEPVDAEALRSLFAERSNVREWSRRGSNP